jgi:hypothetical protein
VRLAGFTILFTACTVGGGAAVVPDAASPSPDGFTGGGPPSLLFREDFEATPLGEASSAAWTTDVQNGSLTIDGVHAKGTRALHVHADGGGRARIEVDHVLPPESSFFGRARIWVDAFPSAPDYAHFTIVEASGDGNEVVRPVGGQYIPDAGKSLWGVGADGGPTGDWTRWQTAAPAEAGRWLCVEWEMRVNDDAVNVWLDGVAHPELAVTRTDHGGNAGDFVFPTFTRIWFGWWLYQGGSTPSSFDVWLDDLELNLGRIGC